MPASTYERTTSPVSAARLFSDDQLEQFATPLSIHLERAANNQDPSAIDWIADQMDMECLAIYDSYLQWVAVLQTFIVENSGEDCHDQALRQMGEHAFRDFVMAYKGMDCRQHVDALARRMRSAGSTFKVEELSDRYRFRLDPWGGVVRQWRSPTQWQSSSPRYREGNRYVYPNYGGYSPPTNFSVLTAPRALTRSKPNLPCFFAAEIYFLEILPIELLGYPIAVITLPESADSEAFLDVFKNLEDIPEDVFHDVGLAKPRRGYPDWSAGAQPSPDEIDSYGIPLSIQVRNAANTENWSRMLQISRFMDDELVRAKDSLGILIAGLLTWIARHLGEDAAETALARTAEIVMAPYVDAVRGLEIKDAIPLWAMVWRSHGSTFDIEEDDLTIKFRGRPLGACGRMWASRYQKDVGRLSDSRVRYPTFGCYDWPMYFHLMREPRGITYFKTDYPIYSAHSHMLHEIYAIQQVGHPLWSEHNPLHDRDAEIVHVHYKDPANWPDEAYERLGKKRPS